ncbi:MAG TPA: hypothetical protein IAB31_11330 [Candidatus Choladousia intestinavium]|uniref:ABC transporter substrate-binding protein n=1 Tax=Candidatus Choladousia intestinavium TaxID=2840727 RepID=A0A9D1ADH0_9FIRM|nr:hypothetical protein [Candidatus Choladousia intestinavium]
MKEKLYTIPLNDAVNAEDECPFCFIERKLEQDLLDFVLGSSSSYMESDIREKTDEAGFCRIHMKKMFDYGNTLGNSLILKTHYEKIRKEMKDQMGAHAGGGRSRKGLFEKIRPSSQKDPLSVWCEKRDHSCYICQNLDETFQRYIDTFFYVYEKDEEFRRKIFQGKGFCLHHFGILTDAASRHLNQKQYEEFCRETFRLMDENLARVQEDITWLIDKFDYRNKDADWKTSKDALQRGMQKLRGGYPADPVYKQK